MDARRRPEPFYLIFTRTCFQVTHLHLPEAHKQPTFPAAFSLLNMATFAVSIFRLCACLCCRLSCSSQNRFQKLEGSRSWDRFLIPRSCVYDLFGNRVLMGIITFRWNHTGLGWNPIQGSLRESTALHTPWLWTSGHQDEERMHFFVQAPRLWCFVTTVSGNRYSLTLSSLLTALRISFCNTRTLP